MQNSTPSHAAAHALKIETLPTDALVPFAENSRTHSPEQIEQIVASIKEFGFTNPVLVDAENGIIAGHGRVMAAKKMALPTVPCIRLSHLTEKQKRAYVIADNKLALNSGWDEEKLRSQLKGLMDDNYAVGLTGFSADELAVLMSIENVGGFGDPEDVPEEPARPVSVLGDLWTLGNHRILCGDCTFIDTVQKLLGDAKPHLMVTDPPYGVKYDAEWRNDQLGEGRARAVGKVLNDDKADWRDAWTLFPGEVVYIWHASTKTQIVAESLIACDFDLRSQIIWAKSNFVIGRGHYHPHHEPCWYAVKKGGTGHWAGDRKQSTLWQIPKPSRSETGHSTQKPVDCMKRPIENNSKPGDSVYEPFSGSGTTIIACETTGRSCFALELNPAYVDVAVERWEKFTGKKAVHESGKTFAELRGERHA